MIDVVDLGCSLLRTPEIERGMAAFGYFGRGGAAAAAIFWLLGWGYLSDNRRILKTAVALLAALLVTAAVTELVRETMELPRPRLDSSFGFPSGHTSAAFSMAGVLGVAFPQFASLFYLLALLTGVSRLYFRAHYLLDVAGGAAIGLLFSNPIAARMLRSYFRRSRDVLNVLGWAAFVVIGILAVVFFHATEQNVSAHKVSPDERAAGSTVAVVDFGNPVTRSALRHGWAADEFWEHGQRSLVWATGLSSGLRLDLPAAQDYFFRLNVLPYSPKGPACQRIDFRINEHPVTELYLEQGWHWYEFKVPAPAIRAGVNDVHLHYKYADSPKSRVGGADERHLSAAFDRLEVIAAPADRSPDL